MAYDISLIPYIQALTRAFLFFELNMRHGHNERWQHMTQSIDMITSSFLAYVRRMQSFQETLALVAWDLRTGAPKKGIDQRAEVIGDLSKQVYDMSISDEMYDYINKLSTQEAQHVLDEQTIKTVEECRKEYERNTQIPAQVFQDYTVLQSKAESAWEQAREHSDFGFFQPYLEKIVDYKRQFINHWGYEAHPYDALLDLYEPGMTVAKLDEILQNCVSVLCP